MRLLVLVFLFVAEAGRAASNAPVAAKNGMVVTAQHLATEVGVDVLRHGGNAVDAAVAVGYALAVVYPAAGNLGGGGFMTLQLADGRKTFLDFREKAPLAATADMYLDAARQRRSRTQSTRGHLAVGVPGTVVGLECARAKYGTMKRARPDRAGDPPRRARLRARRRATSTCSRDGDRRLSQDPAYGGDLPQPRPAVRAPATGWCRTTSRATLRQIAEARRRRLLQGRGRRARSSPPSRAGKGIITQADLDAYHDARAGAGRVRLPRLPHRLRAAAELGRHHDLRDPQHPRGLSAQATAASARRSAVHVRDRGDAPRLRRPQQLLGDPDFVENPLDAPARQGATRRSIRAAIDPQHAGVSTRPQARRRAARRQQHDALLDRRRARQRRRRDLHAQRLVRRARSLPRARACCSTTRWTTSPPSSGVPNIYGLVQGEANAIAAGQAAAELDEPDHRHAATASR